MPRTRSIRRVLPVAFAAWHLSGRCGRVTDLMLNDFSTRSIPLTPSSSKRGRLRRTVYSITPAGREALAAWIELPPAESRWESEAIVKLLFAASGTPEQLLDHLRRFREHAGARWRVARWRTSHFEPHSMPAKRDARRPRVRRNPLALRRSHRPRRTSSGRAAAAPPRRGSVAHRVPRPWVPAGAPPVRC